MNFPTDFTQFQTFYTKSGEPNKTPHNDILIYFLKNHLANTVDNHCKFVEESTFPNNTLIFINTSSNIASFVSNTLKT